MAKDLCIHRLSHPYEQTQHLMPLRHPPVVADIFSLQLSLQHPLNDLAATGCLALNTPAHTCLRLTVTQDHAHHPHSAFLDGLATKQIQTSATT